MSENEKPTQVKAVCPVCHEEVTAKDTFVGPLIEHVAQVLAPPIHRGCLTCPRCDEGHLGLLFFAETDAPSARIGIVGWRLGCGTCGAMWDGNVQGSAALTAELHAATVVRGCEKDGRLCDECPEEECDGRAYRDVREETAQLQAGEAGDDSPLIVGPN